MQLSARGALPGDVGGWARELSHWRRLLVVAGIAIAFAVSACGGAVAFASPIAAGLEVAGIHLVAASIVDSPQVTPERAELVARTSAGNGEAWQVSRITLVTVSGPGNPGRGWVPREHPLAYAVEWIAGSTIGLTLVDARTGEAFTIAH